MSNIDWSEYQSPGVYVDESTQPVVGDRSVSATVIGLIGAGVGYQTATEAVIGLSSAIWTATTNTSGSLTGIVVTNVSTGGAVSTGTSAVTSGVLVQTSGNKVEVKANDSIMHGADIYVTYRYTNSAYYDVASFDDYDDIREMYGEPYKTDGTNAINSPLSLAAWCAMQNGAKQLKLCATSGSNFTTALGLFAGIEVNVLVPVSGDNSVHDEFQAHVVNQAASNFERICILGADGSSAPVISSSMITSATGFSEKRVTLVSPSSINIFNREARADLTIGAQYVAAALAGGIAARPVATSMTRKALLGFSGMSEIRSDNTKKTECANGLCVFEDYRGVIRVRHALTTDNTNINTRTLSVIRAKDNMMGSLRDGLDTLIGEPMTVDTLMQTKGMTVGLLERIKMAGTIFSYQNVKVRQPSNDPPVVEVKFEYKPTYTIEYIKISFGVNTETGAITETYVGSGL